MGPLDIDLGAEPTLDALRRNDTYMERLAAFEELCSMVPFKVGKLVSCEAREQRGIPEDEFHPLVYGETEFSTIALALAKIKHCFGGNFNGATFYDIGCGTGKPMFAAALLEDRWGAVRGIDILEDLVQIAEDELLGQWQGGLPQPLPRGSKSAVYRVPPSCRAIPIDFIVADATLPTEADGGHDWSDGDVVYTCSTCFDEATMAGLQRVAEGLKPGSFFLSSASYFDGPGWELLDTCPSPFSWGEGTLYICRRVAGGQAKENTTPVGE